MRALKIKLEEYRQALSIHGGVFNACMAASAIKLSRLKIPSKRLRSLLYRTVYGKKYPPLDEQELEKPIWEYPSFNSLFTRGVKPECRPIPEASHQFLCPCDGTVQEVGLIDHDKLLKVKGIDYNVDSLLAQVNAEAFRSGHFAIVFLSPSDCHRIFSPQDGHIEEILHVPGYRLLVHPPFQNKDYPVFTLNERMVMRIATRLGTCVLILVAGWGVGNITFTLDKGFRPRHKKLSRKIYDQPIPVSKGEWIATFELGSTAILLTGPSSDLVSQVIQNQQVHYGQPVFSMMS